MTDSNYKHTLGIVRSLGHKKLTVDVGSFSYKEQLSAFSKYCRNSFVYPDPKKDLDRFIHFFRKIGMLMKYELIIPVGYTTTFFLSMKRKELDDTIRIPIADFSSLRIAANKRDSILLANKVGVSVPETFFPCRTSELDKISNHRFPLVIKGAVEGGCVRYAYNELDLKKKFEEIYRLQGIPPIVQEFVHGEGYGFFALFNHGKPRAIFMHKRIRELYAMGGSSTCAESVYDPKLMDSGLKVLNALKWHGVAMVEFKKDAEDSTFKLIEINPKFWGSLDLSIASGVDFPYLLYKMTIDGDVSPVFHYKQGVKFSWPFPDDFLQVLNKRHGLKDFLSDLLNPTVNKNIQITDSRPLFSLFSNGISFLSSKIMGTHH